MRQTGASDEKVEQAARYLRHDYGYAAVGAYEVATDVIGIAVTTNERIITLDDLKRLRNNYDVFRDEWGEPMYQDGDLEFFIRIDELIAGDDAP